MLYLPTSVRLGRLAAVPLKHENLGVLADLHLKSRSKVYLYLLLFVPSLAQAGEKTSPWRIVAFCQRLVDQAFGAAARPEPKPSVESPVEQPRVSEAASPGLSPPARIAEPTEKRAMPAAPEPTLSAPSLDQGIDWDEVAIEWLGETEERVNAKINRATMELLRGSEQCLREQILARLEAIRQELHASLTNYIDDSSLRGPALRERLRALAANQEQEIESLINAWRSSREEMRREELSQEERLAARAAEISAISEVGLDPRLLVPEKAYAFDFGANHSSIQTIVFAEEVVDYLRTAPDYIKDLFMRAMRNGRVGRHGQAGIVKLEPHPKLVHLKVVGRSVPQTILGCLEGSEVRLLRVALSRPTEGEISRRYGNLCP